MIVHGFHPVREALRRRPREVARVLISERRRGSRRGEIEELCREHGIEHGVVAEEELERLAAGVHNGFVAELTGTATPTAERGGGDPDLVVLIEDVQDPRNLGAILRVCEGAGVGRVLVRDRGSAPLSATVVKASAGASQWLPVERIPNTAAALRAAKEEGFWTYGADAAGDPPWEIDLRGRVLLCLGGEEKGLRRLTRESCDRLIGLPMRGRIESLNVASAAAALLYEALRQRS